MSGEYHEEIHQIRAEIDKLSDVSPSEKMWRTASRALIALSIPLVLSAGTWISNMSTKVTDHEYRLTHIEGNRFTEVDAAVMRSAILDAINAKFPPEWLKQSLTRIESQQEKIQATLMQVDDRIDNLEHGAKK